MSSIFSHEVRQNLGVTTQPNPKWVKMAIRVPLGILGFILLVSIGEPQLWLAAAIAAVLAWNRPAVTAWVIFGIAGLWFVFGLLLGVDALSPNLWLPLGIVAGILFVRNILMFAAAVAVVGFTWLLLVAFNLQDLPFVGALAWLVAATILGALALLVVAVIRHANDLSFALVMLAWAIVLPTWLVFSYGGLNYNQPRNLAGVGIAIMILAVVWLFIMLVVDGNAALTGGLIGATLGVILVFLPLPWDLDQVWYLLALVAAGIICWKLYHQEEQLADAPGNGDVNASPDPTRPLGDPSGGDAFEDLDLADRDETVGWLSNQDPAELFYDDARTRFSGQFLESHPGLVQAVIDHKIQEGEITRQTAHK